MKGKFMNSREIKKLREAVVKDFDCFLEGDYAFVRNDKGKVSVVNRDVGKVALENLKVDRMGLYFAEMMRDSVRLSKSGAQLLVQECEKVENLVELSREEAVLYFKGEDLVKDLGENGKSIILRFNDGVVGWAKYKEGRILNFLPKVHRSGSVILY